MLYRISTPCCQAVYPKAGVTAPSLILRIQAAPLRSLLYHRKVVTSIAPANSHVFHSMQQGSARSTHSRSVRHQTKSKALRFTIKNLGDFTRAIEPHLTVGTKLKISRPFGQFHLNHGKTEQVWIAAGVGITPSIAWSQAPRATGAPEHLFFGVTS